MILRLKRKRDEPVERLFADIEALSGAPPQGRELDVERRLLQLRHRAGLRLIDDPPDGLPGYPEPAFERLPEGPVLPEMEAAEVTPEVLRAAILRKGCLLIRGFIDRDSASGLVEKIDRAYAAREDGSSGDGYYEEFEPDPRFDLRLERGFVRVAAGLWAADSPRAIGHVLHLFERAGLRRLVTGYLGERPAISINKCLLRRVRPTLFDDTAGKAEQDPSAWHQDGAFLKDVRALNVWLALTRCGDEAPGLDLVPRRFDGIVQTGTEGAAFDWSVSRAVAEEASGDAGIVRPIFEPGDVLLFDELFLHATAAEPDMPSSRYAIETWFFGPSAFPANYAPLAF